MAPQPSLDPILDAQSSCRSPLRAHRRIPAQQADEAATIRAVDAAVMARFDAISSYTVTEHYAVFRNKDEIHPPPK